MEDENIPIESVNRSLKVMQYTFHTGLRKKPNLSNITVESRERNQRIFSKTGNPFHQICRYCTIHHQTSQKYRTMSVETSKERSPIKWLWPETKPKEGI